MAQHSDGPDFSAVDSRGKADELFQRGQLERLYLLPPEFGGDDNPSNVVYVPLGFAAVKHGIDVNIIRPLVAEGRVTRYVATPVYTGDSFIPIAIQVHASEPGSFSTTINIWGEALTPQ